MIIDPYSTTYGRMTNKENIVTDLLKYITMNSNDQLSYEFITGHETKLVLITGKNADEQDMGIFTFPIIVEDLKKVKHICIDLRYYVKDVKGKEGLFKLEPYFKDSAACMFLINLGIIIADMLEEDYTAYRKHFNTITMSYSMLLTALVSFVVNLTPIEKVDLEISLNYFANLLLIPVKDREDHMASIKARLYNSKYSIPTGKKVVDTVIEKCSMYISPKELDYPILVSFIKAILPEEKKDLITEKVIVSVLSNLWYGHGSNESVIVGLECMPVWISLIVSALGDGTYKRSRLSTVLDKFSRNINKNEFVKHMELYFEEKKSLH